MYNMVNKSCLFIIDTLYNQSVYCIILFVLIFSLSFLLKKKSPRWQLGLWLLILIRLVLPTDLYLSFSARNLADNFVAYQNLNVPVPVKKISDKVDISEHINQFSALNPSRALEGMKSDTQTSISSEGENNISISFPMILTVIWSLGCLIFMALFLFKISSINRVLKNSLKVQDREIIAITDYWRKTFKVKRSVSIFSSDKFLSPFTVGIFRPKIFIPVPFLENRKNETINSIIAHEMVHIKHFDHACIRLQNFLQIIYFFNPIIWYANMQINIARERVCDSAVLDKKVISPGVFGKSVIDALKINVYGQPLFDSMSGFSSHKKIIEYRIKDILRENTMTKQKASFIFIMVCLLGLFLLPMSSGKTVTEKSEIKIEEKEIELVNAIIVKNLAKDKIIRSSLENEIQNQGHILLSSVKDISVPAIPSEAVKKVNQTLMTNNRSTSEPVANPEVKKEILILPEKNKSEDIPEKGISIPESNKTEKIFIASRAAQERDSRTVTHANRGYAFLRKDQFDNAISEFSKAIDLNPGATLCYFGRGQAYMATNQTNNAISDFTRTIELIPIYETAYVMRGIAFSMQGKRNNAIGDYSKAIELKPQYADAYNYRGIEYIIKNEFSEALNDYNRVLQADPDCLSAHLHRGFIYHLLGKSREAVIDFRRALELNPEPDVARELKAYINVPSFSKSVRPFSKQDYRRMIFGELASQILKF